MQVSLTWSSEVTSKFPKLAICLGTISEIQNETYNARIIGLKRSVYENVKAKYDVQTLKDNQIVRAYRDF